ncbi:hypothetical protein BC833DRAFT_605645 [Globomyces pollinis-pini]|nr:hypothetical protein BC833DRAFT_605645 [Globomyces pollinis-pini]
MLVIPLFLLPLTLALKDTVPLLVWGNHEIPKLDQLQCQNVLYLNIHHLHASDLPTLQISKTKQHYYDSLSKVYLPHLPVDDIISIEEALNGCNQMSKLNINQPEAAADYDGWLMDKLSELDGEDYIVILTSSTPKVIDDSTTLSENLFKRAQPSAADLTIPYSKRSLFQKYTFFSTSVYLGLVSMFFVLVILYFGLQILTSLQTPTRFETPKK